MFPRESIQPVRTIAELLATIRDARPSSERGITFYDGTKRMTALSVGEYLDHIAGWAALLQRHGVRKGDRVGTLLKNRIDVPILYLATMSIGAVVVPLNPSYSDREMEFVIRDSGMSIVLTDAGTGKGREAQLGIVGQVVDIDSVSIPFGAGPDPVDLVATDPAITLYTSGTTSFPKGVVQMHGNLIANSWSMVNAFDIDRPNQYSVMPFYHAHAVGFGMMTCLMSGGHLVMTDRMDPTAWAAVIRAESISVTSMVPNLLHLLVRTGVKHEDVPTLRFVFVSAAPLPKELAQCFETMSGIPIAHAWGLSEFTNFATALPVTLPTSLRHVLMFERQTPCVGHALDGTSVCVRRQDGSPAAEGELGELYVSGPSLGKGYHNNPEATANAFVAGELRTGDEGYFLRADGREYFFITDRIKDIIIRSGEKISPSAVEAMILDKLPDLANRIVVLGYPHDIYGEEIGLVLEAEGDDDPSHAVLGVLPQIPLRMRPKVIIQGRALIPRTHTGKIQRRMLRGRFEPFARRSVAMHIERVQEGEAR